MANSHVEELSNESVKQALEKVILEDGIVEYSINLSPGSNKGDNYLGVVLKAEVNGLNKNGERSTLNVFLKLPLSGESNRKGFYIRDLFLRESYIYNDVLESMKKLEAENSIEDGFTNYATCLASGVKDLEEFLILEDLSKSDFVMFDRMKNNTDYRHTEQVMIALGKLHAHSFAMRDKKPELFGKLTKNLPEMLYRDNPSKAMINYIEAFTAQAYKISEVNGIYKEKFEILCRNFDQLGKDCINGSSAEPYAVVTHGDCWNNNMMYKYEDDVPVDVRILDFQFSRYASPACDLSYFIFISTEKSLRDLHYESFLRTYHQSLSSFLSKFGCNPDELFPYSELLNQLQKFGKFGLISAIIMLPVVFAHDKEAKPLEDICANSDHLFEHTDSTQSLKRRMTDVITDIVDLGYL